MDERALQKLRELVDSCPLDGRDIRAWDWLQRLRMFLAMQPHSATPTQEQT